MKKSGVKIKRVLLVAIVFVVSLNVLESTVVREAYGANEPAASTLFRIERGMHLGAINQIAVDRSGKYMVTSSADTTVRLWDLNSGRQTTVIEQPGDGGKDVGAVAISSNGELIAMGLNSIKNKQKSKPIVYLFKRATNKIHAVLNGFSGDISVIKFSPDNSMLAIGMLGGISIYSTESLTEVASDRSYKNKVDSIDFNNQSNKLVTVSSAGFALKLYQVSTRNIKVIKSIIPPNASGETYPGKATFSPNGNLIAVGYENANIVDVLNSNDLNVEYTFKEDSTRSSALSQTTWSLDGKHLFAGGRMSKGKGTILKRYSLSEDVRGVDIELDIYSTVSALEALPSGKIAYGAMLPAWGVVENSGKNIFAIKQVSPLRAIKELQVSDDGSRVNVGPSLMMDIKHSVLGTSNEKLNKPLLKAKGLDFKDEQLDRTTLPYGPITSARAFDHYMVGKPAVAPDGSGYVSNEYRSITYRNTIGNLLWEISHNDIFGSVTIPINGKYVIAASSGGTLRWYRISDGKELLAFFLDADKKRWVLWTPEGFFDHSPGGEELIGFHLDRGKDKEAVFLTVSKLYKQLYRPDLVNASFEGKDISSYAKGSDINKLLSRETVPPTVHFITKSGNAINYDTSIRAQVCDTGGGVGDVTLLLNSMPISVETNGRGLKIVEKNRAGKCYSFEQTITLSTGLNSIQLMAYNKANSIESLRDTIEINYTAKSTEPELHVLTVAVNAYRDGDLRLKYALTDADALAAQMQQKRKGLFGKVHIHTLRDAEVTREGLTQIFTRIGSKMKREDVFLLFVAGHGITDEKEGAYYFLPADFRYTGDGALQKQGVSMSDFRNMLAKVQAMKSLILLDTCNSGSFAESIASRGMTEKTAITKLSRAVGRATIVASSKSQVAMEGYEGHGAFTWSILEGMKGKAADQGGKITINTLATFIEEELPKLTYKKWGYEQIPQKTLQGMDFQIGAR